MFMRNNKKQNIVKFISVKSGPSWATLGLIELVNRLNALGVTAVLYGESHWPLKHCKHYKTLDQLHVETGDTIVNDGFKIDSLFDLINLDRYRYSHGRKRRIFQWARFICRYFSGGILIRRVKVIPISNIDSNISPLVLIKKSWQTPLTENGVTIIRSDVDLSRTTLNEIRNHEGPIVLASAIRYPSIFRDHIAPHLNEKLRYIGFQEPTSGFQANTDEATQYVTKWKDFFSSKF